VAFLHEAKETPFSLYFAHTAVHSPLYPGLEFRGKSKNGLVGDWVAEVDWSVGQVFAALRELELDSRTLVVFTSDNGGTLRSSNVPLRGNKGRTLEGGIRVPTIVRWPGRIPPGTSTPAITSHMDLLPTFAALAEADIPTGRIIDGMNLWAALLETASLAGSFTTFAGHPWKRSVKPTGNYTSAMGCSTDLRTDIGEVTDVAAAHPDVAERMRDLAAAMEPDLGTRTFGPGCRPLGRHPDPQPLISHDWTIRSGFEPK